MLQLVRLRDSDQWNFDLPEMAFESQKTGKSCSLAESSFNFRRHLKEWHCHKNWSLWQESYAEAISLPVLTADRLYSLKSVQKQKSWEASEDSERHWNYKGLVCVGIICRDHCCAQLVTLYILPQFCVFPRVGNSSSLWLQMKRSWIAACQWIASCDSDFVHVRIALVVPVNRGEACQGVGHFGDWKSACWSQEKVFAYIVCQAKFSMHTSYVMSWRNKN